MITYPCPDPDGALTNLCQQRGPRHHNKPNLACSVGNVRKTKHLKDKKRGRTSSLSTDEVLERIQQQMAEVMASAQEAASSAVTNETEARAMVAAKDSQTASELYCIVQPLIPWGPHKMHDQHFTDYIFEHIF